MPSKLILLKLGGSLITNKSKPFSQRSEIITSLVEQIKRAWTEGEYQIIVGHGGGSYPHVPAVKYKTIDGIIDHESVYGAAVVEDAAAQLNRIVVGEFLKQKIPAISVNPSSLLVLDGKQPQHFCIEPVKHMLKIGLLPVIYGDVILDDAQGFTIWSTEQLLNFLAGTLEADGVAIDKIIHCGETDGFLIGGEVVHEITSENFAEMKKNITATEGFDVTGGMLHKIEEALKTATHGIDSYIIGGNHGGNLYRAIIGDQFIGTRIRI